MMKNTLLLLLILISVNTFSQTAIEWQRVELEEKVDRKVRNKIDKVIGNNIYSLEVQVKVNDPGPPNFDDMQKVGLKISDMKFDKSKGDYIAFHKIGLEVPVIEKYYNVHQQQLKERHRYNEAFNVFKNINSATVKVFIGEDTPDAIVANVKRVVNNIKFPLGDIKPKVTFETLTIDKITKEDLLNKTKKGKGNGIGLKEILEFIGKFGNAIGLIFATLLFGGVCFWLMKKFKELFLIVEEEPEEEVVQEEVVEADADEEFSMISLEELALQEGLFEKSSEDNFNRFKTMYATTLDSATVLLKKWINQTSDENQNILRAIAQQLSEEELSNLYDNLSSRERDIWKDAMQTFIDDEKIAVANKLISEEVVRDMIGPSVVNDVELIDLLLTIPIDTASKYIQKKGENSKVLMNLLSPQIISKILDQLDEEEALETINLGLDFNFNKVKDDFAAFKRNLTEFMKKEKRRPFNEKIIQMLPEFNPTKEKILYSYLAKSKMKDEMLHVAKGSYPSELITQLPKDFLKAIMQKYEMNKKVMLLASSEQEVKDYLLSTFADKGSAAREMIDLEFEILSNDKIAQERIVNKKDDIWNEFVMFVREMIKNDEEYASDISMIVKSWVERFIKEFNEEESRQAEAS
jgi:hypothetical protein